MLTEETSKVRAIISAFPKAYPKTPKWFLLGGSYLESYKGIPKRDYYGASGYGHIQARRDGRCTLLFLDPCRRLHAKNINLRFENPSRAEDPENVYHLGSCGLWS